MQLEVKYRADKEIYAIWGPVVVRVVDGATTEPHDIDRLRGFLEAALGDWPTIGMLLISHHGSPTPSLATVRYSSQVTAHMQDRTVVGIALLGLGFWADASRATAAALMRMVRSSVALESSTQAVVRRMALELVGLDPAGLLAACEELDRRFRAT